MHAQSQRRLRARSDRSGRFQRFTRAAALAAAPLAVLGIALAASAQSGNPAADPNGRPLPRTEAGRPAPPPAPRPTPQRSGRLPAFGGITDLLDSTAVVVANIVSVDPLPADCDRCGAAFTQSSVPVTRVQLVIESTVHDHAVVGNGGDGSDGNGGSSDLQPEVLEYWMLGGLERGLTLGRRALLVPPGYPYFYAGERVLLFLEHNHVSFVSHGLAFEIAEDGSLFLASDGRAVAGVEGDRVVLGNPVSLRAAERFLASLEGGQPGPDAAGSSARSPMGAKEFVREIGRIDHAASHVSADGVDVPSPPRLCSGCASSTHYGSLHVTRRAELAIDAAAMGAIRFERVER